MRYEELTIGNAIVDTTNSSTINVRSAGIRTATLAGEDTLTKNSATVQVLDPDGAARDVLLPPEADSLGRIMIIINTAGGAENLVVKEDSDTTTIVTVSQNERAILFCDGTAWYNLSLGKAT